MGPAFSLSIKLDQGRFILGTGREGQVEGVKSKPCSQENKKENRNYEPFSLRIQNDSRNDNKTFFFSIGFMCLYFFPFPESSHPIYRHLEVHQLWEKHWTKSTWYLCLFIRHILGVNTELNMFKSSQRLNIFFLFSCDMLINHVVHIHLPKFKSYHLALFISTIVTKKNFITPFFINFF